MTERPYDQLLTLAEVLDLTGHSRHTGYRWRQTGTGPRLFKRNARIVAWKSDIVEWLAAQDSSTATGGIR